MGIVRILLLALRFAYSYRSLRSRRTSAAQALDRRAIMLLRWRVRCNLPINSFRLTFVLARGKKDGHILDGDSMCPSSLPFKP